MPVGNHLVIAGCPYESDALYKHEHYIVKLEL